MAVGATLVGCVLAVIGTIVTAVGNHLVSLSHALAKSKQTAIRAKLFFWLGNVACIILLGTGCGLAALAFAPQSIVAPLGGLTIVWNLVLAGNGVSRAQFAATVLTLLGMSLVVWFGPNGSSSTTSNSSARPFALFAESEFQSLAAVYVALGAAMEAAKTNAALSRLTRRVSAGSVAGVVGGLSNVFAKSAVEFYSSSSSSSSDAEDQWTNFYLVAGLALVLAGVQIALFNQALAAFPVVAVVPVYMTSLMLFSTVSGGVAFGEFSDFSLVRCCGFAMGMGCCLLGVAVLSAHRTPSSSAAAGGGGDEEAANAKD